MPSRPLAALKSPNVDLYALAPEALARLRELDRDLKQRGYAGILTSGKRGSAVPSAHTRGGAVDFVVPGDMARVAEELSGLGYRARFERKGQRNPNGSIATGDHIHVTLSGGPARREETDLLSFVRASPALGAAVPAPEESGLLSFVRQAPALRGPAQAPEESELLQFVRSAPAAKPAAKPAAGGPTAPSPGPGLDFKGLLRERLQEGLQKVPVPSGPVFRKAPEPVIRRPSTKKVEIGPQPTLKQEIQAGGILPDGGFKVTGPGDLLRLPTKLSDAANAFFSSWALNHGNVFRAAKDAFSAATDLSRDYRPAMVRALAGDTQAARLADYVLSYIYDPSNFIPGGKVAAATRKGAATLRATRPVQAAGRVLKEAEERALQTEAGQRAAGVLAFATGAGPTARMLREVRERYEPKLALRQAEAAGIGRRMGQYLSARVKGDPAFGQAVRAYADSHQGIDPLTDLVRTYVRMVRNKGAVGGAKGPPQLVAADRAELLKRAAQHQIPLEVVGDFGRQFLAHGEGTLQLFRQAGGAPFVRARGRQFEKPLKPGKYRELQVTGITQEAKPRAEERLRNQYFARYVRESVQPRAAANVGGVGGSSAITQALVTGLAKDLIAEGKWVRAAKPGTKPPPGWVALGARDWGPLGPTKERVYLVPEALKNYLGREMGLYRKTLTRFGREIGRENLSQKTEEILRFFEPVAKAVGFAKRSWISSPSTFLGNLVGNDLLAEIALRKNGAGRTEFYRNLATAFKQTLAFQREGTLSPELRRLMANTRAFAETYAGTATIRPEAKLGEKVAGALDKSLFAFAAAHGTTERAYKLALFTTLEKKLGPQAAAKEVQKHLFDYSDRAALLELADRFGVVVFNAFPTKAFRLFIDTMATRPDLALKYPRLSRLLTEEEFGAGEKKKSLPEYRQSVGVVATSPDTFADVRRFYPFSGAVDLLSQVGRSGAQGIPQGLSDFLLGQGADLTHGFAAQPLLAAAAGEKPYSTPQDPVLIWGKGTPPEERLGKEIAETVLSYLPGWVRGLARLKAAAGGVTFDTRGRTSEPEAVADAALRLVGVTPLSGESLAERQERQATTRNLSAREEAGRLLWERAEAEAPGQESPLPAEVARETDVRTLEYLAEEIEKEFWRIVPRAITLEGEVKEAEELKRIVRYWRQIQERIAVLPQ